jgi:hypothetical protein
MCAYRVLLESEYEAPRSKLRGIKAELRRSPYPPSLYRASARFTLPLIPAASCRVFRRRRIKKGNTKTVLPLKQIRLYT